MKQHILPFIRIQKQIRDLNFIFWPILNYATTQNEP